MQFNYIAVAGDDESLNNTLDIRSREGERLGKLKIDTFEKMLIDEYPEHIALPGKIYNRDPQTPIDLDYYWNI